MSGSRPGACIFCGGGNLTTEDVIAKWIARLFRNQPTVRNRRDPAGRQYRTTKGGMQFVVRKPSVLTATTDG